MAAKKGGYFSFSWTIKSIDFKNNFHYISPQFKARSLGDSEWRLYVDYESYFAEISCFFALLGYNAMQKNARLNYRFEQINSMGKTLISSENLTLVLQNGTTSSKFYLIPTDKIINKLSHSSEKDLTVRFHVAYANNDGILLMLSDDVFINCEAETRTVEYSESFNWDFKSTNFKSWTAVKRINVRKIPLEIIFKYTTGGVQIQISSNIEEDWEHKVWCTAVLTDASSDEVFKKTCLYLISKCNKTMPNAPYFSEQHLHQAQCFTRGEIRVKFHFSHEKSAKINYYEDTGKNKNFVLENWDYPPQLLTKGHPNVVEGKKPDDKQMKLLRNQNIKLKNSDGIHQLLPSSYSDVDPDADCMSHLQQDLHSLLMDKTYADVKLRVSNEIISAHKGILAMRSSIFRAMFEKGKPYHIPGIEPEMPIHGPWLIAQKIAKAFLATEDSDELVDIPKVETEVLKLFLEYIYTGKTSEMDDEKATSLLFVARRFQVAPLVNKCLKYLKSVLSPGNACKLLLIADKENDEELKSLVVNFISKNSRMILSSSEWSLLKIVNDALVKDVLRKLDALNEATQEESLPGGSKEVPSPPAIPQKNEIEAGSSKEVLQQSQASCLNQTRRLLSLPELEGRQLKKIYRKNLK